MRRVIKIDHNLSVQGVIPILKSVLLIFLILWIMGFVVGGRTCVLATALSAKNALETDFDPASAVPSDTLFYLEFFRPVETLDQLSRHDAWPEAVSLLAGLSCTSKEKSVLREIGALTPGLLSNLLAAWGERTEMRAHLDRLAGQRLLVACAPVAGTDRLARVFALNGDRSGDPLESLAWLLSSFGQVSVIQNRTDTDRRPFKIGGRHNETIFIGSEIKGWLVLSRPFDREALNKVTEALACNTQTFGGAPQQGSLACKDDFQQVRKSLPTSPCVMAYLNLPGFLKRIQSCDVLAKEAKHLLIAGLGSMDSIGMAVQVDPQGAVFWMTGKVLEAELETTFPGMLDALSVIENPLSPNFPGYALFTYDAGVPLEPIIKGLAGIGKEICPWIAREIKIQQRELAPATGLDPSEDFFPYLDKSFSLACLPAKHSDDRWPFPRTATLVRVNDREQVARFLHGFLRWKAGRVAPATSGLISAMVTTEYHEGVELLGLQLDSLVSFPLPSPTTALVDDYLVISPVRSAVKEVITAIHNHEKGRFENTAVPAPSMHPEAIERIHLNFAGWERTWNQCGDIAIMLGRMFLINREASSASLKDNENVKRAGQVLFQILESIGSATGYTVIDEDGTFTFYLASGD